MEKVTEKTEKKMIEITTVTHIFCCDKCGKVVMEDEEDEYGSYEYPDYYDASIWIGGLGSRYNANIVLCDECADKLDQELKEIAEKNGFEVEG